MSLVDGTGSMRRPGLERRWLTLIAVCGSTFMLLVDITVVQVALPTIQRQFGASFTDLQWVIDAYSLALATLILTWGSSADLVGRKRIFIIGISVFTVASLLCGLSNGSAFLIWGRAAQGIGGAAMFATGLALIGQEFQGAERGKAIAAWGATVGAAAAVGPLVGGVLTSGLGWRWIFFVNVPIGIAVLWLSLTKMVNVRDPGATRPDFAGLVTFAVAMFLLVFGFIKADADGWTSRPVLSLFAASALVFVLFAWAELHQSRPMFDFSLFRRPSFTGVSLATFAVAAGMFACYPYLTLYFQNDLGFSPIVGGLCLLPSTIPCFLVPVLFRRHADRLAPRVVLGSGLAVTAIGLYAMLGVGATTGWVVLVPGLVLTGIGIGLANPAIARVALGVVAPTRSGMASGISNTCRTAGIATGVAALGALLQHSVTSSLTSQLGPHGSIVAKVVTADGVKAAAAASQLPGVAAAAHVAFASGLRLILVVGGAIVAVGALVSFLLVRAQDFQSVQPGPGAVRGAVPGASGAAHAAVKDPSTA